MHKVLGLLLVFAVIGAILILNGYDMKVSNRQKMHSARAHPKADNKKSANPALSTTTNLSEDDALTMMLTKAAQERAQDEIVSDKVIFENQLNPSEVVMAPASGINVSVGLVNSITEHSSATEINETINAETLKQQMVNEIVGESQDVIVPTEGPVYVDADEVANQAQTAEELTEVMINNSEAFSPKLAFKSNPWSRVAPYSSRVVNENGFIPGKTKSYIPALRK